MSKYTAEQVERAAAHLENIRVRVHVDVGPNIPAMLRAYAADLREREAAKGGVTDEVVAAAWSAFIGRPNVGSFAMRAALEAVWPVQEKQGEPVHIVCDWNDVDPFPRFIETEDASGKSVDIPWRDRPDGLKELWLYTHAARPLPESLKDPAYVHVMMLRGDIAVPSIRSMVDLRGDVPNGEDAQLARIAELQEKLHAERPAVPDGAVKVLRDSVAPDEHAVNIVFRSQEAADRFRSQLDEAMKIEQNAAPQAEGGES